MLFLRAICCRSLEERKREINSIAVWLTRRRAKTRSAQRASKLRASSEKRAQLFTLAISLSKAACVARPQAARTPTRLKNSIRCASREESNEISRGKMRNRAQTTTTSAQVVERASKRLESGQFAYIRNIGSPLRRQMSASFFSPSSLSVLRQLEWSASLRATLLPFQYQAAERCAT